MHSINHSPSNPKRSIIAALVATINSSKTNSLFYHTAMAQFRLTISSIVTIILFTPLALSYGHSNTCRSYCGNLTIDHPFALRSGCGHPGFRDLLFCINDVLMFHISSGSYRVLDIDYAYQSVTLHDPHMSSCDTIELGSHGNGFAVEQWRASFLSPTVDNVFMLLGCSAQSPLFQGFPEKHLPCRNVSGMGCEDYYECPAWNRIGLKRVGSVYGTGPPECCAVPFEAIKAVNLTRLDCQGYSSAYSLAPLRVDGPGQWSYGIRVKYSVQVSSDSFCKACESTGGSCGYNLDGFSEMCMCGSWNSTSNCDSGAGAGAGAEKSSSSRETFLPLVNTLAGFLIWMSRHRT